MMTAVYLQSLTECLNGSGLCLLRISPFRQALGSFRGLLTSFSWLHDPSLFKSVLACSSVSNVFITSSIHYSLTLRPCNRAKPLGTKLWQYTGEFRESRGRTMSINWAPTHMPAVASFWVWNREENMLEINQSPSLLWPVLFFFFFHMVKLRLWETQVWHLQGAEAVWKHRQHFYVAVLRRPQILLLWPSTDWTRPTHSVESNPLCCCSVAQSCLTLCDPMGCSTPGFPVHHHLLELAQTHLHWVSGAIQPSHSLSAPSPPAFDLSQHQGLFQWVSSSHQVTKVLELQLQHQSFQWIFRVDFL